MKFLKQPLSSLFALLFLWLLTLSFSHAQEKKLSRHEIQSLSREAVNNMHNELYEKSLIQARTALRHAILLRDDAVIAQIYNIIGGNFDGLLEYEKALFYYNKGLFFANRTKETELKNFLHNNLGNIYFFDKKNFKKGVYHYNKSLGYSTQTKDTVKMVFTKINITWAFFDIEKYKEGYRYLAFVNTHFKKYGDPALSTVLHMLNGMYFKFKKQPEKATTHFTKAIKTGIENQEKSDLSYTYLEYSRFLNQIGKHQEAYRNLEKYNQLTEEINSEEKIKKANLAGINLELDEYKREIDKIAVTYKNKETIWKEEQSRNKKIVLVIVTLSILILIIFYFLAINEKLKQKNKLKELQNQNQQNLINATIDGQESERRKIAAFLHDNISALLSSAGMHINVFSSKNEEQSDEILKTKYILEEAHHKVRDLSHELMPALLVRFGLMYALDDLCEKNSNSQIQFEFIHDLEMSTRFEEAFEMKLYFIVSELLNNILKHSKASHAKLHVALINNQLHILVKDNGKGFNENSSSIEGFGINRIKARIHSMHGEIYIVSDNENGSSIELIVPVIA